jgi:hypothetical protein
VATVTTFPRMMVDSVNRLPQYLRRTALTRALKRAMLTLDPAMAALAPTLTLAPAALVLTLALMPALALALASLALVLVLEHIVGRHPPRVARVQRAAPPCAVRRAPYQGAQGRWATVG